MFALNLISQTLAGNEFMNIVHSPTDNVGEENLLKSLSQTLYVI
jgi:hypothetical protein